MAILAGIDEAGFGPLLGPLVVSSAAFSFDPASPGAKEALPLENADLWDVFRKSVGKCRKHLGGRLLIADSKKAYHRSEGLGHLERTSLAILECMDRRPANLHELLWLLCPECIARLAEYPWYQELPQCLLAAESPERRIAARVFADDLRARGAALAHVRTCCLDVAHFNRMVNRVRNKAQVLFIAVTQLIQALLDAFPRESLHILIDRQGGRAHYRENLLRSFPDLDLAVVRESEECSVYEMRRGAGTVRLTFEIEADDRFLPVSLASMVSKYVRELLMDRMNLYFAGLDAGLKPTAGYWQDGQRFVEDLRVRLPHLKIDNERLIRCR